METYTISCIGSTSQGHLQVQCNLYRNTNSIFTELEQTNSKIYVEIPKTSNSQNNLKKGKIKLEVSQFMF